MKAENLYTVAFYNLENLFDTEEDPYTLDREFTPEGRKHWTPERYQNKLRKLGRGIAELGKKMAGRHPSIVGVAEVENETALQDLLDSEDLKPLGYEYVHFDSPDERGIDTALLFNPDDFKVWDAYPIPLQVMNVDGMPDMTRDILYVHGALNGEAVHVFVNHWPSRRDGDVATEYKRLVAAEVILEHMDDIATEYPDPNFVIMGDFNDDPNSESIQRLMESGSLYNPMEQLLSPDLGSAHYRDGWQLFDQILISHNLVNFERGTHQFAEAHIFHPYFLSEWKEKYKGQPFRTFVGDKYLGGISDHFPVYIVLEYHKEKTF